MKRQLADLNPRERVFYLSAWRERKQQRRKRIVNFLWLTVCCIALQGVLWVVLSGLLRLGR